MKTIAELNSWLMSRHPIAYVTALATLTDNPKAGLLLSQMIYWTRKSRPESDGWITKSSEQWRAEIALSRHELKSARDALLKLNLIEDRRLELRGTAIISRIQLSTIGERLSTQLGSEMSNPLGIEELRSDAQIVRQLLGRQVAFHRILADITNDVISALLLSQIIYHQGLAFKSKASWIGLSGQAWSKQTGISRNQFRIAKDKLCQLGFIRISTHQTWRGTAFMQTDLSNIASAIEAIVKTNGKGINLITKSNDKSDLYTKKKWTRRDHPAGNHQEFSGHGVASSAEITSIDAGNHQTESRKSPEESRKSPSHIYKTKDFKTTTTTAKQPFEPEKQRGGDVCKNSGHGVASNQETSLMYPTGNLELNKALTQLLNQHPLIHRHQSLLDELLGVMRQKTLYNPVGYFRTLVQRDKESNGNLLLEYEPNIRARRNAAQPTEVQPPSLAKKLPSPEVANSNLKKLREMLSLPQHNSGHGVAGKNGGQS